MEDFHVVRIVCPKCNTYLFSNYLSQLSGDDKITCTNCFTTFLFKDVRVYSNKHVETKRRFYCTNRDCFHAEWSIALDDDSEFDVTGISCLGCGAKMELRSVTHRAVTVGNMIRKKAEW